MKTCAANTCTETFAPRGQKAYCSRGCRLREHRAQRRAGKVALPHHLPPLPDHGARVRTVAIDRAASFCFADPPYPGRAHLYPENTEVDHQALIAGLVEDHPDGWALSTGSAMLQDVLAMCPQGVRVASWHRQHRPYNERPRAWEPVIFCGGRRLPDSCTPDALVAAVPPGWDLPGRKPPAFYRWLFGFLGMLPGDSWHEQFPGSGTGGEAFEVFVAGPA